MSSTKTQRTESGAHRPLPKKLIVCCDGSWKNSLGAWYNFTSFSVANLFAAFKKSQQLPTNITRIARAIKTIDTRPESPTYNHSQIIYYQAGIGSSGTLVNRLVGGVTGAGLAENIREAYAFIATNYVEGDEVFLLGFSRGAYTARAVGGLIGDMGLLKKQDMDKFFDVYFDWNFAGKKGYEPLLAATHPDFRVEAPDAPEDGDIRPYLNSYREYLRQKGYTTPQPVVITALGVFETVGALGIPVSPIFQRLGLPYALHSYRFYNTSLSSSGHVLNAFQVLALDERRSAYAPTIWEKPAGVRTNLKQTWMPGAHSGVGGGYPDTGISDISLAWMMSQLAPWIDFDVDYISKQHKNNVKYLEKENVSRMALQWAASQLRYGNAWIEWLLAVRVRAPGQYTRIDPITDRPIKEDMLQDTNERIHQSVRSRMATGGLNEHNRMTAYAPKAMADYVLDNPDAELGKGMWRYRGKEKALKGKVLEEDELGLFERELFRESSMDFEAASASRA